MEPNKLVSILYKTWTIAVGVTTVALYPIARNFFVLASKTNCLHGKLIYWQYGEEENKQKDNKCMTSQFLNYKDQSGTFGKL